MVLALRVRLGRPARGRRYWWAPDGRVRALTLIGAVAVAEQRGASVDLVPVAVGFVTWLVALSLLTEPLRAELDLASSTCPEPTRSTSWSRCPPGTTPGAAS